MSHSDDSRPEDDPSLWEGYAEWLDIMERNDDGEF